MDKAKLPSRPFEWIAMTLSGGGYRAAAFHLGSLDYLNRISYKSESLLKKVKTISTVSGGTICGALYALHVKKQTVICKVSVIEYVKHPYVPQIGGIIDIKQFFIG